MCLKNGWTETLPKVIHVSAQELVPLQVRHEYIPCNADQTVACLKYLIRKEYDAWKDLALTGSPDGGTTFQVIIFVDDEAWFEPLLPVIQKVIDKIGIKTAYPSSDDRTSGQASSIGISISDSDRGTSLSSNDQVATAQCLSESMSLDARAGALASFKDGSCAVLICSGLASRGIDIPNISHVVQVSLPKSVDEYLHRAGRVGRMGRPGKAVTLIAPEEGFAIERYANELGIVIHRRTVKITEKKAKSS
jgi:superfamily II DNA/RNA helicase